MRIVVLLEAHILQLCENFATKNTEFDISSQNIYTHTHGERMYLCCISNDIFLLQHVYVLRNRKLENSPNDDDLHPFLKRTLMYLNAKRTSYLLPTPVFVRECSSVFFFVEGMDSTHIFDKKFVNCDIFLCIAARACGGPE